MIKLRLFLTFSFFTLLAAGVVAQNYAFPTQSPSDNSTKPATTAYADAAASALARVTSVATTSPLGGGTITSTGTLTCTTCVVASSPGAGVAHFAGSTQTVTSSAIVGADMTNNTVTSTQLAANIVIRDFGTTFGDTTGAALTSGSIVYFTVPYSCTIAAWNITADAGTVTFDIWKIATGTAIPTVTNTITASALPALASGTAIHSTTLTSWTTSVTANDIFGIQLKTVATAKYVQLDIQCNQ